MVANSRVAKSEADDSEVTKSEETKSEETKSEQVPGASIEETPEVFERFDLRSVLGVGAFGTVWAAYDRERAQMVALKVLNHADAAVLYRFKEEFRALANISHPNLVVLHELCCIKGHWFFTMNLVHGCDFRRYVRGEQVPDSGSSSAAVAIDLGASPHSSDVSGWSNTKALRSEHAHPVVFDEVRLRASLIQLARGLCALHDEGKLHCDIKPSNVLVTSDGRVVILDFGLVSEIGGGEVRADRFELVGTPAYMSPEQAGGFGMTQASDWYAVGVMLYEALTSRRPFVGVPVDVLAAKQSQDAPEATVTAPNLPEDLARLAMDLLRRTPDQRPSGSEVMRRLEGKQHSPIRLSPAPGPGPKQVRMLVGRSKEVAALWSAFRIAERGEPVTVHVRGPSGFGKSALVGHFLERVRNENRQAVVLRGRCYEQESVPYKALDNLVDALARFGAGLPDDELLEFIPPDVYALARLFPVLRQVPAIARASQPRSEINPHELRKRAFYAMRDLLSRIARRWPLILFIDDLQWGDVDSALFLRDLFEPPLRPPLLLLECFREEDLATSEVLGILRRPSDNPSARVEIREVIVGPLDANTGVDLALALLARSDEAAKEDAAAIARESLGSPFFVRELVQRAREIGGLARRENDASVLTLDNIVAERVQRLEPAAYAILGAVAVAGVPIALGVVQNASGVGNEFLETILTLRQVHLIRTRGPRIEDPVEAYHDRVREVVVRSLSPAVLRDTHKALGVALEDTGRADPEALATHFHAAGEMQRAWQHTLTAAQRAEDALAFEKAAKLYRRALELDPQRSRLPLFSRLGNALANAGRGRDAGEAFLKAAEDATSSEALELRRRAAEQFLRSGHIDRGLTAIRSVLSVLGMTLPRTPLLALLSLLLRRALVRIRGLGFRLKTESEIDVQQLRQIDTCFAIAMGLGNTDNIRGADFNTRALLLALNAGEPFRLVRALCTETVFVVSGGTSARARADSLLAVARNLVDQLDHLPLAKAWWLFAAGLTDFFTGRFLPAWSHLTESEAVFEAHSDGMSWELATVRYFLLQSLEWLGRSADLVRLVPLHWTGALDKGDLYFETNLGLGFLNAAWLVGDDVNEARRVAHEASQGWSRKGFHLQHFLEFVAYAQLDLYDNKAKSAYQCVQDRWRPLARSMLLRIQNIRVPALHIRGRTALAAARQADVSGRKVRLLGQARQDGRRLASEPAVYASALGSLVLAGVSHGFGDANGAIAHLQSATKGFDLANMSLYAAVTRRRLGQLVGGHEGQSLIEAADAWMTGQTIQNPLAWARMLAPGFGDECPTGDSTR